MKRYPPDEVSLLFFTIFLPFAEGEKIYRPNEIRDSHISIPSSPKLIEASNGGEILVNTITYPRCVTCYACPCDTDHRMIAAVASEIVSIELFAVSDDG